jgi:Ankyrin repeats (many copies)
MTGKTPKKKERPGVDRMGRTPLHYAALGGKFDEAKSLLAEGADPNACDDNDWTPLHFASQNWQTDVASLLLSSGAKVDAQDSTGTRRSPTPFSAPRAAASSSSYSAPTVLTRIWRTSTACRRSVSPKPSRTTTSSDTSPTLGRDAEEEEPDPETR